VERPHAVGEIAEVLRSLRRDPSAALHRAPSILPPNRPTHQPTALSHSPAVTEGSDPTNVVSSLCPRVFTRRTQKPFSSLWKVTRSISLEISSVAGLRSGIAGFMRGSHFPTDAKGLAELLSRTRGRSTISDQDKGAHQLNFKLYARINRSDARTIRQADRVKWSAPSDRQLQCLAQTPTDRTSSQDFA
jgi:hypothetical protein